MGTGIKGFKSQKMLKGKLSGYTETQSFDPERYATIQELTGDKHGLDVVIHGGYSIDVMYTASVGSNIRKIVYANHNANAGDYVRFVLSSIEASILSIPDADTMILASELSFDPTGLDFFVCRHITPSYNSDGSLNVVAALGPVQFKKDGVSTEVNYVTATPTNSDALPVNIVTVNGVGIETTVNLSGAQINVQLSDRGTSPDSVLIGDGVEFLAINASNEALVHDEDVLAELQTLNLVDFATEAKQDAANTKLDTLNAKDFSTATKQDSQITQATNTNTKLDTLIAKDFATSAKQDTQITALADVNTELDTQTTRLNLLATEVTLAALKALIPVALGQGTMAQSLRVVLPSDQAAIPTNSTQQTISGTITSTQKTVGVSAVRATVAGTAPSATRKKLIVKNSGTNSGSVYIGGSGVTTANGMQFVGPDRMEFILDSSDYYLVSDTASQTVEIIEVI